MSLMRRSVFIILLGMLLYACQTPPQSPPTPPSMPSASLPSPSSPSSSSSSSSPSASMPSPSSPSSSQQPASSSSSSKRGETASSSQSGQQSSASGSESSSGQEAGGDQQPSAGAQPGGEQASQGGSAGESGDDVLSAALEAFENARGNAGSGADASGAMEATDFPILLPQTAAAGTGDGLEQGGAEGENPDGEGDTGGQSGQSAGEQAGIPAGQEGAGAGGAQTADEKLAVLDRSLEESYGRFEGMILRERDYVRGKEQARGAGLEDSETGEGPGGAGGEQADGSGYIGGDGEYREPISGSGSGNRPANPDQRDGDFEQVAATNPVPPDIPDGSDDDVVARQLREAAMKETDSELRDKLWEEYRKYKNKGKEK